MDSGYCEQEKAYKIVVGTDEGQVIVFEPNAAKPQHIIECGDNTSITCVKWSKNLQYLAISTDSSEVFVYTFKQSITIETYVSYRILKTPNEYLSLNSKQLKSLIVELYFVE
jgi:WD40 repeat protein